MRLHLNQQLGTVAHACHPKLCRRLKSRGLWFQDSLGKKFHETPHPHLKGKKLGMAVHPYHPSCRIKVQADLAKNKMLSPK
jgi:hypothetical protein